MHSHDRTLLTSLGFADPDKKNPRHDMACQYLATHGPAKRLSDLLIGLDRREDVVDDFLVTIHAG